MSLASSRILAMVIGVVFLLAAGAFFLRQGQRSENTGPPKMYSLEEMPRVDVHMHIRNMEEAGKLIRKMNEAGITISVNLSGKADAVSNAEEIHKKWKGRILQVPRTNRSKERLWWSTEDLDRFAKAGCAGTKIHFRYAPGINSEANVAKLRHQGKLGLPVIGLHIADPPEGKFYKPNRLDCIKAAIETVEKCPGTTFIMAHGFWLMNNDEDLDKLGEYFDRYPNLNVDLSAVYQWWSRPKPTPAKLRAFVIRYKDRLLYGTDGNPKYTAVNHYRASFGVLESSAEMKEGFFGGGPKSQTIKGLALPVDVLNYIYYWNAARLVPKVRESLLALGYKV